MTVQPGHSRQRGEVASLLTIISMVVLSVGLFFGYQISRQAGPINTSPFAQSEPTPIQLESREGRWFDASQGLLCKAEFTCVADPILRKVELKSADDTQTIDLAKDVTGRANGGDSPIGKLISGSCSGRFIGMSIEWDPRIVWTPAQRAQIKTKTGYDIKDGQILLSLRQRSTIHNYYIYDRPTWLTGSEDVLAVMTFDADTSGVTRRYAQTSRGIKGCGPAVTPTTTISVTPPSTSPTPTILVTPTPTIEGGQAQCFEACSPTVSCGKDPISGKPMKCYDGSGFNGIQPPRFPTDAFQKSDTAEANATRLKACENGSATCLCLPTRCETNPESCGSVLEACTPPPPLTVTPPDSLITVVPPSVTKIPPQACAFNALSYVQICDKMKDNGECERKATNPNKFIASPATFLDANNTIKPMLGWGASNNKQIATGRYGNNPALPFIYFGENFPGSLNRLRATYPYIQEESSMTYIEYRSSVNLPAGKNPLAEGDRQILFGANDNTPANEKYFNFERATVRLFANFASKEYRVVPDGNEIVYCQNSINGSQIGCVDSIAYQEGRTLANYDATNAAFADRDPRDSISGLKVGCGQNIVYGWTLQKCNNEPADYIFVIDTSTSMTRIDLAVPPKIEPAKAAIKDFLTNIQTYNKGSRAGLIQFSSKDNSFKVADFTTNLDTVKNAVDTKLTFKPGTCIECGLTEAVKMAKTVPSTRKTYVIVLTDGLPNSDPGNLNQPDTRPQIKEQGEILRGMSNVTTIGIGVGDPAKANNPDVNELIKGQLIEVIKTFTSDETWALSANGDTNINEVFTRVLTRLNSCSQSAEQYANFVSSQDINGDGVINTIDLFLIYDNYFARGQNVPEDLNNDQVVNSLDVSIIVNNMGKTVPKENNTAQKSLGDVFN